MGQLLSEIIPARRNYGFSVFGIVKTVTLRFLRDKCGNFAIIISYFALMCSIPLAALFAYSTTKILGTSELAVRSLDIFSEEFFATLKAKNPFYILSTLFLNLLADQDPVQL